MNSEVRAARRAGAAIGDHPLVEKGARLGYAANGLVHLLIAWLALQLAWGRGGGGAEADQTGALRVLAGTPLGNVLLWTVAIGFGLLAVWSILETIVVVDTKDRVRHLGKGVVYLVLMWSAIAVLRGTGGSGSQTSRGLTARLMEQPWGPAVVVAIGLGVAGVGVYHVVKGWTSRFLRDLRDDPGAGVERAGQVGYIAKGIALVVLGGLFVVIPWTGTEQAPGLDGALRTILDAPYGPVLLTLVALGLAAYGLYSFARAKHARV